MTRYLGEDGVVQIGGTGVGQVTNFDYSETGDRIDYLRKVMRPLDRS